jgi:hypothetical protein
MILPGKLNDGVCNNRFYYFHNKMELYTTKKLTLDDEFTIPTINSLPYIHVITPLVEIKNDNNGNLYIASSEDPNCIANLVKLKKIILKQEFFAESNNNEKKIKLTDDVIWIKPSAMMMYKNSINKVYFNKILTGTPIKLHITCKKYNMISYDKPYNSVNLTWSVDTITVDDNFDFNLLMG